MNGLKRGLLASALVFALGATSVVAAPPAGMEGGFQGLARALERQGVGASGEKSEGAPGSYVVGSDTSGVFFDPAQNGHGFMVQHIVSNGEAAVLVAWFAYLEGAQRWFIGVGQARGNEVRVPLVVTSGGDFPPRFQPDSVALQSWGELLLRFDSRGAGTASWTSSLPAYPSGSMPIERLTEPASGYESTGQRVAPCHAGSWFDPAQSGHGLLTEVLGPPDNRLMLAIWYAYLDGQQRWMTALGPVQGDRAVLSAQITSGGGFPPAFDPAAVVSEPWGTIEFIASDANQASLQWNSPLPGFGSGSMPLQRLTGLTGSGCGPTDDAKAARFLTQASYGPKTSEVQDVRTLGFEGWIEQQLALPPTLHRPTVELQIAADLATTVRPAVASRAFRVERWFDVAINAPDQLRQRVAFALSQIMVISDTDALINLPIAVAEYNDILVRNAFGNYRNLLREVSLSPMMGMFLTHLRNLKTDWTVDRDGVYGPGLITPDENFAREVMQLFSIGLVERNRDFTPILIGGEPVATYTQELVTQTARVLTGHSFACNAGSVAFGGLTVNRFCGGCQGLACQFSTTAFFGNPPRYTANFNGMQVATALTHPDMYRPMVCYPRYADTGRSATSTNNYAVLPAPHDVKLLLAGISIPPSPVACHTGTVGADQQACVDYCDNQIETLIDTLYLHPNVPPMMARQLIQRLTTSNPSPGYIERVAARFEDDGNGVRGNLGAVVRAILLDPEARAEPPHPHFGKLREPMLGITALWRAFQVQRGSTQAYGLFNPERFFPQRPLGADSVFNFYEPDFQQPGEIADAGLFSPEFQILNESTTISSADALWGQVFNGYNINAANATTFTLPQYAHLPPTVIDALPSAHAELIEALNQRLLYGSMPTTMRARLQALLDGPMATADARRKALSLIHLIVISPAFAVQH